MGYRLRSSTYAERHRTILNLPAELICDILSRVLSSSIPVQLERIIGIRGYIAGRPRRHARFNPTCYKDRAALSEDIVPIQKTAHTNYVLRWLVQTQIEHYWDWHLVNSTCTVFAAFGKPAFFQHKVFLIPYSCLDAWIDSKSNSSLTASDLEIARRHVRNIVVSVKGTGAALPYSKLSRYHYFSKLRKLSVEHVSSGNDEDALIGKKWTRPLPEALLHMLRWLEVKVENLEMELLCETKERARKSMIIVLTLNVCPVLRTLVRARWAQSNGPQSTNGLSSEAIQQQIEVLEPL